jgi:hypothetical protein
MYISIYVYIYPCICISMCLSIYVSIYLSIYLSIHLYIYLYTYLSIYPSIYMYLLDVEEGRHGRPGVDAAVHVADEVLRPVDVVLRLLRVPGVCLALGEHGAQGALGPVRRRHVRHADIAFRAVVVVRRDCRSVLHCL